MTNKGKNMKKKLKKQIRKALLKGTTNGAIKDPASYLESLLRAFITLRSWK
nr:MAG TPA: hypothetical protein [Caudoviricetes sp.]